MVADGVDTMNKIGTLVEEIEGMLKVKKADLEYYWEPDTEGWVEALQYVLRQIEYIVE